MIPTELKEFHGIYHFHCLSLNNKSNVFIQIILVKQCAYNLHPVAERVRILPRENKTTRLPRSLKNLPIKYQDMEEFFLLLWNVFTLVQKLDLTVSTTFEMVKMSLSSRILCSFLCTETKRNIKIIIIYSNSDNLINESCFLRKKEENINLRGRKFEERFLNFVLLFSNLSTLFKNRFTARLRLTFACNIVCM